MLGLDFYYSPNFILGAACFLLILMQIEAFPVMALFVSDMQQIGTPFEDG